MTYDYRAAAIEKAAEALWDAIGYQNLNGVHNPYADAAERVDAGAPN